MRRTVLATQLALAIVFLAGCTRSHKMTTTSVDSARTSTLLGFDEATAAPASTRLRMAAIVGAPQDAKRFIAVQHKLVVVSPETDLPKNWQAVIDFCGTIRCEVVSSSIITRTHAVRPDLVVSATALAQ